MLDVQCSMFDVQFSLCTGYLKLHTGAASGQKTASLIGARNFAKYYSFFWQNQQDLAIGEQNNPVNPVNPV